MTTRPRSRRPAEPFGEGPVPPPGQRTTADIVARLERFPFRPRRMPVSAAFGRMYGADTLELVFGNSRTFGPLHRYPRSFRPVVLHGADDVHLAGMRAMHDRPAPALILNHGLLGTMHYRYLIRVAVRAYEEWGFHVVTWDQRGCGGSVWMGPELHSAGWHEGEDLVEIARELKSDDRVTSVHVVGFSLGGLVAHNGARVVTDQEVARGVAPSIDSVMAVSAPSHAPTAIDHISRKPPVRDDFRVLWHTFRASLRYNAWRMGVDGGDLSFVHAVHDHLAPSCGVDALEYAERASAVNFADRVAVPTLHLHATDDFCVPFEQAERLERAAQHNGNVHVWALPVGNHAAFDVVDPRWTRSVVRRWVEYWDGR